MSKQAITMSVAAFAFLGLIVFLPLAPITGLHPAVAPSTNEAEVPSWTIKANGVKHDVNYCAITIGGHDYIIAVSDTGGVALCPVTVSPPPQSQNGGWELHIITNLDDLFKDVSPGINETNVIPTHAPTKTKDSSA